jgi:CarD family transcriptional regulator
VIEIPTRGSTVFIPMRKMEEVGVRPAMSPSKVERVISILASEPRTLPKAYKKRHAQLEEKLATGKSTQIAEVIRDLSWREELDYLTKIDARLLDQGRKFLSGELAVAMDTELDEANEMIDKALAIDLPEEVDEEPVDKVPPVDQPSPQGQAGQRVLVSLKDRLIKLVLDTKE